MWVLVVPHDPDPVSNVRPRASTQAPSVWAGPQGRWTPQTHGPHPNTCPSPYTNAERGGGGVKPISTFLASHDTVTWENVTNVLKSHV